MKKIGDGVHSTVVCVSEVMFIFRKIRRTLFSCYLRFKIRPFALLPMSLPRILNTKLGTIT